MGRYASIKQAGRTSIGRLNRLLDVGRPPSSPPPPTSIWFASVYRERNAGLLRNILTPASGWHVHLWALDEASPLLREATRGAGSGGKFELLQRLLDLAPPPPDAWLVFSDDDLVFRRGDLGRLLGLSALAGFDVAQPAHRTPRNATHHITVMRPRLIARRTHFVEIGPLFVFSPRARGILLPFPPETNMGWGIEAIWSTLSLNGELSLGIVDGVTIDHLRPPAGEYDQVQARREQAAIESSWGSIPTKQSHATLQRWHRGRQRPW